MLLHLLHIELIGQLWIYMIQKGNLWWFSFVVVFKAALWCWKNAAVWQLFHLWFGCKSFPHSQAQNQGREGLVEVGSEFSDKIENVIENIVRESVEEDICLFLVLFLKNYNSKILHKSLVSGVTLGSLSCCLLHCST